MQIASILKSKGSEVFTVAPDAGIAEAVTALRDRRIGALVVSSDGKSVEGILSERDIVHGLADRGTDLLALRVSDLMTRDVMTCRLEDTGHGVLGYMTQRRVRHVPVVEDGELCGMVSIGDVVKSRLDEIMFEADALRNYISLA